jgi:osmotically-inducible protein OsmY
MPRTVLLILVFLPALVMAQSSQPTDSSASNQAHAQPTPAPNPQDQSDQNQRIQSSIDDLLSGDQILSGTDVNVAVDDVDITLTGHVDSYSQHQRVLQLVSSYGRWRKIVDKVQMK